jgi:hypothetical protein
LESNNFAYKCQTCNDGKICWDCCGCGGLGIWEKIWDDIEIVRDAIKCPCCRQENWCVVFDNTLDEILEFEDKYFGNSCYEWGELGDRKPALNILLKNYKDRIDYQEISIKWKNLMLAVNLRKYRVD